jgi:hypothetical protein
VVSLTALWSGALCLTYVLLLLLLSLLLLLTLGLLPLTLCAL